MAKNKINGGGDIFDIDECIDAARSLAKIMQSVYNNDNPTTIEPNLNNEKPLDCEESGKECGPCKKCGGKCCKTYGCQFSPDDFEEISYDYLRDKMESTGCISIDWWEGDPRPGVNKLGKCLFLRMRHQSKWNSVGAEPIIDASWGGRCILHTDEGCPLSYEDRPKGARWLIANPDSKGHCYEGYPKNQCAIDWLPYQDILFELMDYFSNKEIPVNEYKK